MIVDTSALMAILLDEPEKPDLVAKLAHSGAARMSAGFWVEIAAVQVRGNTNFQEALDALLLQFRIVLAPVSTEQARIGHAAYREYGIGSQHPARLNFGDCFAYALAKETGEPLLFKGDNFVHTDIRAA
jgi:ribonuclease VapC